MIFCVELLDESKVGYDTIMKDIYEVYKKSIGAYVSGRVSEFRIMHDDILNSK